jgi:hypothetical protein
LRIVSTVALLLATPSCFEVQGTHTLYLDPGGQLVWSVLEQEVRFDDTDDGTREQLQRGFLERVVRYENTAARALAALHPGTLTTRVLREDTPPAILTDAYFPGIDGVYANLFALYEVPGSARLSVEGDLVRLDVVFWPAPEEDEEQDTEENETRDRIDEAYDAILFALFVDCRIVLTEGKFVEARGFEIVDSGTTAVPDSWDSDEEEERNTPVELYLVWTRGEMTDQVSLSE